VARFDLAIGVPRVWPAAVGVSRSRLLGVSRNKFRAAIGRLVVEINARRTQIG